MRTDREEQETQQRQELAGAGHLAQGNKDSREEARGPSVDRPAPRRLRCICLSAPTVLMFSIFQSLHGGPAPGRFLEWVGSGEGWSRSLTLPFGRRTTRPFAVGSLCIPQAVLRGGGL